MISLKDLATAFYRNLSVVKMQTEGLTQADTLLQLPFRGNCMNWVVGHIAQNRDEILEVLGEPPVRGEAGTRYKRESEALVESSPEVLPLEELLGWLDQGQERIAAKLKRMDEADLEQEISLGERKRTLGQQLFFLYFHEAYHVGQTELLRQLAGKNDKII